MAKCRLTHSWNETADLMALLANLNSTKSKRWKRSHFHPLIEYQRTGLKLNKESLRAQRKQLAR